MRANTSAILAHPGYSKVTGVNNEPWGLLKFPSIRAAHEFTKTHARTTNESSWQSPYFIGLDPQTLANFDSSGVSQNALTAVRAAKGKMQEPKLTFAGPRASIAGAVWDIPAVLAGIPLCARQRVRTRLAPLSFHFLFSAACDLDAREMGEHGARVAGAIHAYILAGGVVNLTISRAALNTGHRTNASTDGTKGLIVQSRVNTSDLAELSLVFSPAYIRGIAAPLITAFSAQDGDSLPILNYAPLSGVTYCGGPPENFRARMAEACKALKIV